jgi:hypothetical protein
MTLPSEVFVKKAFILLGEGRPRNAIMRLTHTRNKTMATMTMAGTAYTR